MSLFLFSFCWNVSTRRFLAETFPLSGSSSDVRRRVIMNRSEKMENSNGGDRRKSTHNRLYFYARMKQSMVIIVYSATYTAGGKGLINCALIGPHLPWATTATGPCTPVVCLSVIGWLSHFNISIGQNFPHRWNHHGFLRHWHHSRICTTAIALTNLSHRVALLGVRTELFLCKPLVHLHHCLHTHWTILLPCPCLAGVPSFSLVLQCSSQEEALHLSSMVWTLLQAWCD